MTLTNQIRKCIEDELDKGINQFIIFPFGNIGMNVKNILTNMYEIKPLCIIDNYLCKYNSNIKPLSFLKELEDKKFSLILSTVNTDIYEEIKKDVLEYIEEEKIVELEGMKNRTKFSTKVGKYSYGPLCNHHLVESVGAFCSFANTCKVLSNHAVDYLSTSPFIYHGNLAQYASLNLKTYEDYKKEDWYFEGVFPKGIVKNFRKIEIGNDVWLGDGVKITNGANIGNGVIAGAGTIITKDIPDYAIVVGVPGKIIRYRYTSEQIKALNTIQWWNWSDEKIRYNYDDFFLPIDDFIRKHIP